MTKTVILRLPHVRSRTGMATSSIYDRMATGDFPSQIKLGRGRAVGWLEHEIDAWLEQQINKSRGVM